MTMTRRLFSMLLPAAPTVASEVGKTVVGIAADPSPAPFNTNGMLKSAILKPANLDKFYEAQAVFQRTNAFKYHRNQLTSSRERIDPNIMALKSVSPQHKAIMHIKQEEREQEANRTFIDELKETFGLVEYFKKVEDDGKNYPGATIGPWL